MKRFLLIALFGSMVGQLATAADSPVAVPPKGQSPNTVNKTKSTPAVVGHLETRNRVITIYAGSTYSVKTKDGKVLAEKVSLEVLPAKFPDIHKLIQTGLAKDGSFLDGRLDSRVR